MKQKIMFICPSMEIGGAERLLVDMLQHLDRTKFVPVLVLLKASGDFLPQIPKDVRIIDCNKKTKYSIFRIIFFLARTVFSAEKPALVLSFLWYTNITVQLARFISGFKPLVIFSVHNCLEQFTKKRYLLAKILIQFLYPFADVIVTVSKFIQQELVHVFKLDKNRILCIYNGIDQEKIIALSKKTFDINPLLNQNNFQIVSCGRLTYQKNYPLLIDAVMEARKKYPIQLTLIGGGEDFSSLNDKIKSLDAEQYIFLLGKKVNPFPYIHNADCYVLPSRFEGFPVVLLETMVCGIPIIATDCPGGNREIIEHNKNGLVVPQDNIQELTAAIETYYKNKNMRYTFSLEAKKTVQYFEIRKIVREYEAVFEEILMLSANRKAERTVSVGKAI